MRPPGYETTDGGGAGRPIETRENMTRRQVVDVGRPRQHRGPDGETLAAQTEPAQADVLRMRLRLLELA